MILAFDIHRHTHTHTKPPTPRKVISKCNDNCIKFATVQFKIYCTVLYWCIFDCVMKDFMMCSLPTQMITASKSQNAVQRITFAYGDVLCCASSRDDWASIYLQILAHKRSSLKTRCGFDRSQHSIAR